MENVSRELYSKVSIIVPCKEIDFDAQRCIAYCEALFPEAELLVIPDSLCPGYPALKRNWAMARAKGEIFAFLDSDAYPSETWLAKALYWLQYHSAVCGPGMLPHDAPPKERIADIVYQALPYAERVVRMSPRTLAEYPTFNLFVRRSVASEFPNYLTGEDSLFCRRIQGGIFYHPDILVYHNRRPAMKRLWKQIGTYGRHRGNFIKLAFVAWISSVFVYGSNFIIGFCKRRPS